MELSSTQEMIDEIMDEFDFMKVYNVMKYLDWHVYLGNGDYALPSISDLKKFARKLMYDSITEFEDMAENDYVARTGPFMFEAHKENNLIDYMQLFFVVTSWDADFIKR